MSAKAARRDVAPQFDVVAIGASAGGVEALHVVAAALPAAFPVPVLIRQHMDPRHKSMLARPLGPRGMPQAARATQCVDFTLPLEEIGPALASLVAPPAGDET